MKTGSKWQGHLVVTSSSHLCFVVQFKVDEWVTLGSRPTNWPWGKSFSHPRLMYTHPSTLFPALQPPKIKSLYSRKQQVFSLPSLGYKNQREKWMFSSENWHWTEGRKRLFQFKHVLISGEVGTEEGQNWLRNQWESHKFCLLSQQLRFALYSAAHSFFSFKRVWIMNNHFLNSQVQKSLSAGRKGSFWVNL